MEAEPENFEQWALVELFGHQRIAGKVSEAPIGGGQLIRVDVPDAQGNIRFTRMYGVKAIYSLNPISKQSCLAIAANIDAEPVREHDIIKRIQSETGARELLSNHTKGDEL